MTAQGTASPAGAPPHRRARRARRARGDGAPSAATVSAASATLALAWLILLSSPVPSHGFFRPTTRVKTPPAGPTPINSLPRNRPVAMDSLENGSNRQARTTAPLLPMQRLTRRYSGSPLLMSGEEAETTGETEEGEAEEEEEEEVQLPTVEVPEMMSEEVSVRGRGRARGAGGESDRADLSRGLVLNLVCSSVASPVSG